MPNFLRKLQESRETFSFDDVLILPRRSIVLPAATNVQSRFSRTIVLKVPFVSSPMDTVTGHKLAIAIACEGGIGVIHRNQRINDEAEEIARVKRYQSGTIVKPYTLKPTDTIERARALMREKNISGILIIQENGTLAGILTKRDIQFGVPDDGQICGAMTKRKKLITAPAGTDWKVAQAILAQHHIEKLPIVDGDFQLVGLITRKDIEKRRQFPNATQDDKGRLRVAGAVGATGDFLERAASLVEAGADALVVDSSHGHSENVLSAVLALKKMRNTVDVVAGNIASAVASVALICSGADGLRVGIGPGSICTTRIVTGCGVPQMSAIAAVADAARDTDKECPVIADGGIRYSGDVVKALAVGADCVMIGSLFAGTDESPGDVKSHRGWKYKVYRGMGSEAVLKEGGDRYGAKAVAEGVEGRVPYRGPFSEVLRELEGGLRQGMGYAGASTISDLHVFAELVRVTHSGLMESHPHDIEIMDEPSNYRRFGQQASAD